MTEAPSVDPIRIEAFYQALGDMHVDLDADPLALGPKRINNKTAECRTFLSKTERMFLEVSQDLYWYRREHRKALADFELAVQDLMSNDPEVRSGRSIQDREAIAHTKLRSDRERISVLQFASEDLEAVLIVVKTKRNDLKDIASRLRDQLKICQEEISLGARWGANSRAKTPNRGLAAEDFVADGVEAMLDLALVALPEPDPEGTLEESVISTFEEIESLPTEQTLAPSTISDSDADKALESFSGHLPQEEEVVLPTPKVDQNLDEILDLF